MRYAQGRDVKDLTRDAKAPMVNWKTYQKKIADDATINDWAHRWPGSGIGIITGSISNLVVIDDDRSARPAPTTQEEITKSAAADALIASIERIPTAIARTARGRHFYFRPPLNADRYPLEVPTNVGFLPGIDTRGEGGYVLSPPSLHPTGVSYIWESPPEDGICELPYWVYQAIVELTGVLKYENRLGTKGYASSALPMNDIVAEGGRNDHLTKRYGSMIGNRTHLDWPFMRDSLMTYNLRCCRPPLELDEVNRICDSIEAKERAKAGDAPIVGGAAATDEIAVGVTASELRRTTYAPPKYAVKDFILEGVTQFFGKPKAGKSFLAMQISLAVARGIPLFPRNIRLYAMANHPSGFETQQGDVLYLALEDSERRLDTRIQQIMGSAQPPPENLTFLTRSAPLFGWRAQCRIEEWIEGVPNPQLVVIDPLAAFVGEHQGKGNVFRAEYRMFRPIWEVGQKYKVPIIIVDHASKSKGRMGSTDPFDAGSGTLGGQAAVDTIMIMEHEDKAPRARISFKGRDIERGFLDLEHDAGQPAWRIALPKLEEEEDGKKTRKGHLAVV